MIYYLFTALVIALQFVDMATTLYILNRGGREANPVMDKLFKLVGLKVGLGIKVVLVSVSALIFLYHAPVGVILLAGVYLIVCCWNLYQIIYVMNGGWK